ncbi:MAG: hypothetical protein WBC59_10620 [Phycisphaerae bacterium]
MRTFLLIVGIVLILIGLVASLEVLMMIPEAGLTICLTMRGTVYPVVIGHAVFCAVLYASGFAALYLRHRMAKPNEGE